MKWEYKIIDSQNIDTASRRKGPTQDEVEEFPNRLGFENRGASDADEPVVDPY